jgi:DNA replication and repair protein RecF
MLQSEVKMHITQLSLTNFRNYRRLELDLPAGTTVLLGENAQGKTNLLEAIYYLATTRSPYATHDSQLISWEAQQAAEPVVVGRLAADMVTAQSTLRVEMRLIKEQGQNGQSFRREALVNKRKVRLMDLLSNLRVVQFLPQDVQMITGSPAGRRRYLDITLCQTDPLYCRALAAYNKVLEQRNALLRQMAEEGRGQDLLPIFTEKLVKSGSQVLGRRAQFLVKLAHETQRIHYESLTGRGESVRLGYLPRLSTAVSGRLEQHDDQEMEQFRELAANLAEATPANIEQWFHNALLAVRNQETSRGRTLLGPHRDDWRMWVNGRDLALFGSRGQQRTAILALKMAEIKWMWSETNDMPVLLLDEVVAELDERRRKLLLDYVEQGSQAVLSATDPDMFPAAFLQRATRFRIKQGQLEPVLSEETNAVTTGVDQAGSI